MIIKKLLPNYKNSKEILFFNYKVNITNHNKILSNKFNYILQIKKYSMTK